MQQVDFVDDDESNQLSVSFLSSLSSDDVPLFGSAYDDLGRLMVKVNLGY